jgi:hypothetical protein
MLRMCNTEQVEVTPLDLEEKKSLVLPLASASVQKNAPLCCEALSHFVINLS